jgi:arylamine N-acetyltransferase
VSDLDAYLERIGLGGRSSIAQVHRAHLTSIPFENSTVLRIELESGEHQTPKVLSETVIVKTGAGSLFGLVIAPEDKGIYFVDDGENALNLLH